MRALQGICVVAAPLLAFLHVSPAAGHASLATAPFLLAATLLGIVCADLLTGGIHWACDTWGNADTRVVGPALIRGFREHHREPEAMVSHDWIQVNGQGALPACLALSLLLWPFQATMAELFDDRRDALFRVFATSWIAVAAATNQLHQWAHQRNPARLVRWLQHSGLILSPARHAFHHRASHDRAYCVSTGWMNPLLDGLGCWRGLERVIAALFGASPQRGDDSAIGLGFGGVFKRNGRQNAVGGLVGGEGHERPARARLVQRRGR